MKVIDLIGYQLINIDNEKIIISKGNKTYVLNIDEDYGDCCGYNEIKTELLINEDTKENPIITNIECEKDRDDYGERCKITFYGTNKPIAMLDSISGSDSGWTYGACVTIICKELNIKEIISEW